MAFEIAIKPFGSTLLNLGERFSEIVVLDADLQRATETEAFARRFPDRYYNVGVAEANMVGISAGLALSGKTVFCGTFACFITQRVCDQVVIAVAYTGANVRLCGFEPGLYSGGNGATHQSVVDLALMRAIPNMRVFDPGDATELNAIMEYLAGDPGPAYLRAPRGKSPIIFNPASYHFQMGKATCLREGTDLTIIACGIMLERAIQAAESLASRGVSVRLLSMPSIKPLDEGAILSAAADTGCIITAENHNILGGLGGAVAEVTAGGCPVPVVRIGIRDRFGEVGTSDWLAAQFQMTPKDIVAAAEHGLELKKQTNRAR